MIYFLSLLVSSLAQAHIPPAFFLYEQISTSREKAREPSEFVVAVTKISQNKSEEFLGSYPLGDTPPAGSTPWPAFSLLTLKDPEALIRAVEAFGIPVAREQSLLRAPKEKIAAMKEAPRPFYTRDTRMRMKRMKSQIAWVHSERDVSSVWIEKDSFLPLKVSAPCPEQARQLLDSSNDSLCELEIKNAYGHKRGDFHGTKFLLKKEGSAFTISFALQEKKSALPPSGSDTVTKELVSAILR